MFFEIDVLEFCTFIHYLCSVNLQNIYKIIYSWQVV